MIAKLTITNTVLILFLSGWTLYDNFFHTGEAQKEPKRELAPIVEEQLLKDAHYMGAPDAKNTVFIYNSFTCPYCSQAKGVLKQVNQNYPNEVRIVYKHFMRNNVDYQASMALECAGDQGKFWEAYYQLFAMLDGAKTVPDWNNLAKALHISSSTFSTCIKEEKHREKLIENTQTGQSIGVDGTPAFVINGELRPGFMPYEHFIGQLKGL